MITCYGENIRDIRASEFSEEIMRHHAITEAYLGRGNQEPTHRILCDECGGKLQLTAHYDFGGTHPRRQTLCTNAKCGRVTYIIV